MLRLGQHKPRSRLLTDISDYRIPTLRFEGVREKSSDCNQNVDSAVRFQVLEEVQK